MESGSDARLFHIALPRMDNGKGRARWGGAGLAVLGDRALHFFKKGSCNEAEQFLRDNGEDGPTGPEGTEGTADPS